jgi:methyl-accepting chemotaxis protein
VATVISVVLGVFLVEKVRENSRMLELEAAFDEAFQAQLAASDAKVMVGLISAFAIFLIVLAILSVFITHRMVGPVYVMRRYLRELGTGTLPRVRRLRRGDEFVDLFETLVETLVSMERRAREEIALLERLRAELPADAPVHADLDAMLARKRAMIQPGGVTGDLPPSS